MTRRSVCIVLLTAAFALHAGACGGGDDDAPGNGSSSGRIDLAADEARFTITFRPGDLQGGAPSSIASGDFNADGIIDLLLGAPFADGPDAARTNGGEALVLYGPIDGDRDLSAEPPDVRLIGAMPGDMLGAGVAAGDLNDDGIDDLILGAPGSSGVPELRTDMGEAYVVFGGDLSATMDIRDQSYDSVLQPAEGFSTLGKAFAVADVNADGVDDLVAGAPYAGRAEGTPPGSPRTTVGEVYVAFGASDFPRSVLVAEGREDVRLSGVNSYDQFGGSVAAADVNGDGTDDIVVGATGFDGPGGDQGEAGGFFVFFGGSAIPSHETYLGADLTVTGADPGDTLGTFITAADLNDDGKAEVIGVATSAAGPANGRFASGEVALIDLTSATGDGGALTASSAIRIYAPTDGELMSGPIAVSAGDSPRIAIGSTLRTTPDRLGAGWIYVLDAPFGSDIDLASADSGALEIKGAEERHGLGGTLAFVDLDGDGREELLAEAADGVQSLGENPAFVGYLYVIDSP
jgi:hypothetical protein